MLAGTETLRGAYNLYCNDFWRHLAGAPLGKQASTGNKGSRSRTKTFFCSKRLPITPLTCRRALRQRERQRRRACRNVYHHAGNRRPVMLYAPTLCLLDLFYDNGTA